MMATLEIVFLVVCVVNALFYIDHIFVSLYALWHCRNNDKPARTLESWPKVTVQIPLKDEADVIERGLTAIRNLDYPWPQLQVQVLDDSEDETKEKVAALAARFRREGFPIEVLWREKNTGMKAGALNEGLKSASGDFIAMFDADFVPRPDFLKKLVPIFYESDDIGFVQGRWSFLNESHSWLTRTQATLLNAYMLVEQPVRSRMGLPFTFNGTAGIWRRACIDDSGGWHVDCVIEDLDLTCRAWFRGWKFRHEASVAVPCDLPNTLRQFRFQQRRWTKGAGQILRKYALAISAAPRPFWEKVALYKHVLRKPAALLLIFLSLMPLRTPTLWGTRYVIGALALLTLAVYLEAGKRMLPAKAAPRSSFGFSVASLGVFLAGFSLLSVSVYAKGFFLRDPSYLRTAKGPNYRSPFDFLCVAEIFFGIACAMVAVQWLRMEFYASVVFPMALCLSFLCVGAFSLFSPEQSRREEFADEPVLV